MLNNEKTPPWARRTQRCEKEFHAVECVLNSTNKRLAAMLIFILRFQVFVLKHYVLRHVCHGYIGRKTLCHIAFQFYHVCVNQHQSKYKTVGT